jgi:hypothetical protein
MKKLLLLFVAGVTTSAAFSQSMIKGEPGFKVTNPDEFSSPIGTRNQNKLTLSTWYDPVEWLVGFTQNNGLQTFVSFLLPDSLPKRINAQDTIFRFHDLAVGQVIDPKDVIIQQTDDPGRVLSQFVGYTVDSIYFQHLYVRHVDSLDDGTGVNVPVVDTLFIHYFNSTSLTRGSLQGSGAIFARPSWDITNLTVTGQITTQTVLLTGNDSTFSTNNDGGFENSWRVRTMSLAVPTGLVINPSLNNYFGYVLQFKPGMPYDSNSVYIYQQDPANFTGERVNYFGYRFVQNNGPTQWQSTQFVNNSLYSAIRNAYFPANATINNGWTGFIPGNAYFSGRVFMSGMHITTTDNVGLNDFKNELFAATQVYPNPAHSNEQAAIGFNLKESANVIATITNMMGQQVKVAFAKQFEAGENAEMIDIAGLKAGVYFVTLNVNGVSVSKKLTIID